MKGFNCLIFRLCGYSLEGINYKGDPSQFGFLDYYGRSKLYQVKLYINHNLMPKGEYMLIFEMICINEL